MPRARGGGRFPWCAPLALAAALLGAGGAGAGVLSREDLAQVAEIRQRFEQVLTNLIQAGQGAELARGDAACLGEARGALLQIAGELRSYESLITIEDELTGARDEAVLKETLRFAVENALKILDTERARMGEIAEQCAPFPNASGQARAALRFLEGTTALLRQVRTRL